LTNLTTPEVSLSKAILTLKIRIDVFPGGHLSPQDGPLPPLEDIRRHEDSRTYRSAAIRECFEESGLLLARQQDNPNELVDLSEQDRDEGRKTVHAEQIAFNEWLEQKGGIADLQGLVPFTRWLTPADLPKRFSTQMYLYFLPVDSPVSSKTGKGQMHIPTPDGGVEHTAARFLYPQEWIDLALSGDVVLFPPQFFLLALLAPFLTGPAPPLSAGATSASEALLEQRMRLMHIVENDGDPPWGQKCISPYPIKKTAKYLFIGMEGAGPELQGTHRRGDTERVLRMELAKDKETGRQRPQSQAVLWRKDVFPHGKERL